MMDEDNTVQQAVELMSDHNVGSLIVTSKDQVVGVFTERDLVKRVVGPGKDPANTKLGMVSTVSGLVTISHDSSCQEAIHKMRRNNCRRLLVYRGERFIGLVSMPIVAYALAEQNVGKSPVANVFVGIALAVAISIIAVMIYMLPDMFDVVRQATGK